MRLDEVAAINTGLVTARKQARGFAGNIIQYKKLNLKAITESNSSMH